VRHRSAARARRASRFEARTARTVGAIGQNAAEITHSGSHASP